MRKFRFPERYGELDREQKIHLLAALADDLTLYGRGTYTPGGRGLDHPKVMRDVNEALHRLCGQLRDLAAGEDGRYPDDAFVRVMQEHLDVLNDELETLLGGRS